MCNQSCITKQFTSQDMCEYQEVMGTLGCPRYNQVRSVHSIAQNRPAVPLCHALEDFNLDKKKGFPCKIVYFLR